MHHCCSTPPLPLPWDSGYLWNDAHQPTEHCLFSPGHILQHQSRSVLSAFLGVELGLNKSFPQFLQSRTPTLQPKWRPKRVLLRDNIYWKHANQVGFPGPRWPPILMFLIDVAGDLVLIHGNVLHKSERNTSSQTRYAYTFHMIDTPPYAHYDEKNWLQPTLSMPFPKILDAPNKTTRPIAAF